MKVKKKVRTPGNRISVHRERSKVGIRLCANCKQPLNGIPRLVPSDFNKLSKTKKVVNRIYGGYLCGSCAREVLKVKAFNL